MASRDYSGLKRASSQHRQHLQPCLRRSCLQWGCLRPTPAPASSAVLHLHPHPPKARFSWPQHVGCRVPVVFPRFWRVQKALCCGWVRGEGRRPCHPAWAKPCPQLVGTSALASPVHCSPPLPLSFLPSEGGKEKEEQPYEKNVNLLITEYIAVHLKCCCYANTLGVYFLNPGVKRLVPRSPAELFEYVAAATVSV